jgi:hypothetical protein
MKEAGDLVRTESKALEEILGYCKEFSVDGGVPVDVEIKRAEAVNYVVSRGKDVPSSYEVNLLYIIRTKALPDKSVKTGETIACLAYDQKFEDMDFPPFATTEQGIVREINMQIAARLFKFLKLMQGKNPAVGNLHYYPESDLDVYIEIESEEDVRTLPKGTKISKTEKIPEFTYQISDNLDSAD